MFARFRTVRTRGTSQKPQSAKFMRRRHSAVSFNLPVRAQNENRNANCINRGVVSVPTYLPNCDGS
jgi:hypothetical protein